MEKPQENNINTGLNLKRQEEEQQKPEKHLMGAGAIWPVIKSDKNWTDVWLQLKPETQFGARLETMGCTGYNTANILEMIWKFQYGLDINISDRALNKMSGTTRNGNTVDAPIDTIRKQGFLLENEWSWDRDSFDWNDYYASIPADKLKLANSRNEANGDWEFPHEYVPVSNKDAIINALATSPLGGTVPAWYKGEDGLYHDYGYSCNHWAVVIIGYKYGEYWLCGDSYPDDFQYNDNPTQQECIKKLAWDFKFGCIKRYRIIDKRQSAPKISLFTLIKNMDNFFYYWDLKAKTHNFYYIGTPAGYDQKYRQKIDWQGMDVPTRFVFLALRKAMRQSSWGEIQNYPDISTINQKFA